MSGQMVLKIMEGMLTNKNQKKKTVYKLYRVSQKNIIKICFIH